jgi:RHS repeat-associated protein
VIEERQGGDVTAQYVYGILNPDVPIVKLCDFVEGQSSTRLFYATDAFGKVTSLVNGDTGAVVERYLYDPYGAVTFLQGTGVDEWDPTEVTGFDDGTASAVGNEILYAGYRYDTETSLYQVRNREYDPVQGRFLQRDPMGYAAGTMNLYGYCGDNPITRSDPKGLAAEDASLRVFGLPYVPGQQVNMGIVSLDGNKIILNQPISTTSGEMSREVNIIRGPTNLGNIDIEQFSHATINKMGITGDRGFDKAQFKMILKAWGREGVLDLARMQVHHSGLNLQIDEMGGIKIVVGDLQLVPYDANAITHTGSVPVAINFARDTKIDMAEMKVAVADYNRSKFLLNMGGRATGILLSGANIVGNILTALEYAGVVPPAPELIENEYVFSDGAGSKFCIGKCPPLLFWGHDQRKFISGPRVGQEENISREEYNQYLKQAEDLYGRYEESFWFPGSAKFYPGTLRKNLPIWDQCGRKLGYIDETGKHLYEVPQGQIMF